MRSNAIASDTDPPAVDAKPRLLSWRWWKALFEALKFWKYSTREWAIYGASSLTTDAKWLIGLGVFKPVAAFVSTKLPWLLPGLKAVWAKLIAGLVVLFHALSP